MAVSQQVLGIACPNAIPLDQESSGTVEGRAYSLPGLRGLPLRAVGAAPGLSKTTCAQIRRGDAYLGVNIDLGASLKNIKREVAELEVQIAALAVA